MFEEQPCCERIKANKNDRFASALETHCRSAIHVSHLFSVDYLLLKRLYRRYRQLSKYQREVFIGEQTFAKIVSPIYSDRIR